MQVASTGVLCVRTATFRGTMDHISVLAVAASGKIRTDSSTHSSYITAMVFISYLRDDFKSPTGF